MKAVFHIVILFFLGGYFFAQEITLPFVKNGNWFLLKNGQEVKLPPSYTFVHFFDKEGFAYFQEGQKYGVIDQKGKEVVSPKYSDLTPFGNAFFAGKYDTNFHIFQLNSNFKALPCLNASSMDSSWILIEQKDKHFILNSRNYFQFEIDSSSSYEVRFNHLIVFKDSDNIELYNYFGKKIYSGNGLLTDKNLYVTVVDSNFNYIFDSYSFWHFPTNAKFTSSSNEYIQYQLNGNAFLLDRNSKKTIISYPCDKIKKRGNYFEVEKNQFYGLIDQQGKILLPIKYDFFNINSKFIEVNYNTLMGLYSLDFKEIIPCKYKSISYDENFFYTTSLNAFKGLISRKTNREILAALYDNITISKNIIKAKYNGVLSIVELDSKHKILNKVALGQTVTLKMYGQQGNSKNIFDPRLFQIGWFFDTIPSKGLRWGIKSATDSVILKPKYKNVNFVQNAPFSFIIDGPKRTNAINASTNKINYEDKFHLVDFSTGKKLKTEYLMHVDTVDFRERNFARFKDSISFGIVTAENKLKRLTWIDLDEHENVRYCNASSKKLNSKPSLDTYSYPFQALNCYGWTRAYFKLSYTFEKPKWNFLNQEGDSIFQESFDYVENYYANSVLLNRNGKWGVAYKDSITIPLEYATIKRVSNYQDTVFLVSRNKNKALYLDSNLSLKTNNNMQFEQKKGIFTTFKSGNKTLLYNSSGELLLETEKAIKFHDFSRFVIRDKKTFTIYDENAQVIGDVKTKPLDFISPDEFIFEVSSKKGLLSTNEDTLIPANFDEIQKFGSKFLAHSPIEMHLYNADFKLILKTTSGKILVDSLSGYYVLVDKNKASIFNSEGKKLYKWNLEDIVLKDFFNKMLFTSKHEVKNLEGKNIDFKLKIEETKFLKDGYFALRNKDKFWIILDAKNQKIAENLLYIRKIQYLDKGIFGLNTKKGFILYNDQTKEISSSYKAATKNWEEGLLLVEKNHSRFPFEFVNENFENILQKSFKEATVFTNGFACVSDERGWTIIDKNGFQKSYPNFNKIEQLAKNNFLSSSKPLYGLVDHFGKTILPVEYEKITFINENIIQTIKEGVINYFDYAGKVIY